MSDAESLERRRDAFASFLDAEARDLRSAFEPRKMAAQARALGVMSADEIYAWTASASLPDWVSERVAARGMPPKATDYTSEVLTPQQGAVAPIRIVEADRVRVYARNFMRVAATPSGLIPEMTSTRYQWLLDPVLSAEGVPSLSGLVFDGIVEGSAVFSHWLFDTVPKILLALRKHRLNEFGAFVFATVHTGFHKEALARIGIDPARCVTRAKIGPLFDADRIVWVSPPRTGFRAHPQLYRRITQLFRTAGSQADGRRFYISRARAKRRKVVNEEELWPILERHGYQVIRLEDYGISGAADLLQNAEHVIGPHGGGMANIAFAGAGCRVTEFYSLHCSREYELISEALGFSYESVRVPTHGAADPGDFLSVNGADMLIPARELEKRLLP